MGAFTCDDLGTSLLQLRIPENNPEDSEGVQLVQIHGPKIRYERGAAVAFNVRDCRNTAAMVNPELVQKMAEKEGIFLGLGFPFGMVRGGRIPFATFRLSPPFFASLAHNAVEGYGWNDMSHGQDFLTYLNQEDEILPVHLDSLHPLSVFQTLEEEKVRFSSEPF